MRFFRVTLSFFLCICLFASIIGVSSVKANASSVVVISYDETTFTFTHSKGFGVLAAMIGAGGALGGAILSDLFHDQERIASECATDLNNLGTYYKPDSTFTVDQTLINSANSILSAIGSTTTVDLTVGSIVYIPSTDAWLHAEALSVPYYLVYAAPAVGTMESIDMSIVAMNSILSDVRMVLYEYAGTINSRFTALESSIASMTTSINTHINSMASRIEVSLKNTVASAINLNAARVEAALQYLVAEKIDLLADRIDAALKYTINIDVISGKLDTLIGRVDSLISSLPTYGPSAITKPQVQVQTATQTVTVSDYGSFGQAFKMKLGWIPEIFDFLEELFRRITYSDEPPKIKLNLAATEGSYKIGSEVVIMDFSWYERFKPYVDTILSGFLWVSFAMHLYRRTPDILSGIGLAVDRVASRNGKGE